NRKFSRTEICAAFGVPEEIITTTEKAKFDVMAGARLNFVENRVAPLCSRLEAEVDATVKSIDKNAVGWFDLDSLPIMQEARRARKFAEYHEILLALFLVRGSFITAGVGTCGANQPTLRGNPRAEGRSGSSR